MLKKIFSILILLAVICFDSFSQPLEGRWAGKIDVMNMTFTIEVSFSRPNDSLQGTIDVIEQNAKNLPLSNIKEGKSSISFEMGGRGTAYFNGKIKQDSIAGTFSQAGIDGTFYLVRSLEIKKEETEQPETVPYKEEEVTFTNGSNTFAGTLSVPPTEGRHPAVVMITGSGPQNRDEDIYGFKVFKVIADHLTRNGIAVLRYDDRGIGGSKGQSIEESTTDDFAGDVVEAVEFLQTRSDINPDQIGLIGHSEGGIVAPLAFTKYDKIAFMVLIAGTGVKGIDIIKEQSKLIMKADSASDKEIEGYIKMQDMIYETSKKNTGWDDLKEQIRENMEIYYDNLPEEQKKYIKDKNEFIKTQSNATIKQFRSNWMRYFMDYDPAGALSKVTIPVLMLFGEKDLQVPPTQNEKPMTDALNKAGNKDFTVKIIPKANHLFQEANTGSPGEYAKLKKEFIAGFLDTITDWILQRVAVLK